MKKESLKKHSVAELSFVSVAILFAMFVFSACSKDFNETGNNSKVIGGTPTYSIPLQKGEIDMLAEEIDTAHNYEVFALYNNSEVINLNASNLCDYVENHLRSNIDYMGLKLLPAYIKEANNIGLVGEICSNIGGMIANGDSVEFPNNVDEYLITHSMNEYYGFVRDAFLKSNTYDEFDSVCKSRLRELCDSTSTIADYFYMSVGGNITFASFCAWVTIFSGIDNTSKTFKDALRNAYSYVKEKVTNALDTLGNWVAADVAGGVIGGAASIPAVVGIAIISPNGAVATFGTSIIVGGIAGSINYSNNH
ncbi:MAG: hypothetical protein SPJ13_06215 [Bacteroidales bacterium]|nr:hypothetical protein [Bacteroidales bacterium]